jgi:hypothetical protein
LVLVDEKKLKWPLKLIFKKIRKKMNSLKEEEALPHHENGMGVEPEEKIEKEKIEDKKENSS